ncbi:MAG: efflux RND transporter permease subunit, partial [Pseudomonadota bacterium]
IKAIVGNPVMPFVAVGGVAFFVIFTFGYFGQNSKGVEFFVETEPERAIAYVRARGNMGLDEQDELVRQVEAVIADVPGVSSIFAFAGSGGLSQGPADQGGPIDSVGQVQIELDGWEERYELGPEGRGKAILADINERLASIPGIQAEISELAQGPAQGKPVHLRITGENWEDLLATAGMIRAKFDATETLRDIEDSRPLPGIDWQIDVDVEKAGKFGASVATVGGMVQLVTRGILLDTMRVDSSDEEIDIRVRLPQEDRVLSTLDTLRVRTPDGLVPLANFVSRQPVPKLGQIDRINGKRYFDVKAGLVEGANANAEIEKLSEWLATQSLPEGISTEWTGDQEEQAESQAFLGQAFIGALGLMFVILLAQFNSIYNSILVLVAVVFSVSGALWGMILMDQTFSIIMTGTGIVALAGIVVNNRQDCYRRNNFYRHPSFQESHAQK